MKQNVLYLENYLQCLVLKDSVIRHLVRTDNLRLTIKQTLGQQPCLELAGTPSVQDLVRYREYVLKATPP